MDQRGYDEDQYAWRHPIKNLSANLKQYRAIATRYDKRACVFRGIATCYAKNSSSFLATIHIRCLALWLNIS